MEQGWDDDVKAFFKKILFSICYGLFWMMSFVAFGLFGGYANPSTSPLAGVIIFYVVMFAGLVMLARYLYRTWGSNKKSE